MPKYTGYLSIKVFKGNDKIHLPNWLLVILAISGFLLYILYLVALGYYLPEKYSHFIGGLSVLPLFILLILLWIFFS